MVKQWWLDTLKKTRGRGIILSRILPAGFQWMALLLVCYLELLPMKFMTQPRSPFVANQREPNKDTGGIASWLVAGLTMHQLSIECDESNIVHLHCVGMIWAMFQYPIIRLIVRSREVSKQRDWYLDLSDRYEIWQAPRQHCCDTTMRKWKFKPLISRRGDFTRYYDETSYRILKRGPGCQRPKHSDVANFLRDWVFMGESYTSKRNVNDMKRISVQRGRSKDSRLVRFWPSISL